MSFLDTLPEVRAQRTIVPDDDRLEQFGMLVRWQMLNSVRLDDVVASLVAEVDQVSTALLRLTNLYMLTFDLLTRAGLAESPWAREQLVEGLVEEKPTLRVVS